MNVTLRRVGCALCLAPLAFAGAAPAQPPQAGEIVTWAPTEYPWFAPAPPPGPFVKIAIGSLHGLALRPDGTVVGFGDNLYGQASPPAGQFAGIAASGFEFHGHSYGIRPGGSVEHWGETIGTAFNTPPAGPFVGASAFGRGVLLLRDDGSIVPWGVVGNPTVPPPGPFTAVANGGAFAVAIRTDGTLQAWGSNAFGLLNVPAGTFAAVAAGTNHAVGIRSDGTLAAWGANYAGQLNVPGGTFKAIAVGHLPLWEWTLALRTDGTVAAWGDVEPGLEVSPPGRFVAIGAGMNFGAALAGCYADCNNDGAPTVADFGCFQTRFVEGTQYADCTGDGQLTVADFGCFQTAFVAGCP